MRRLAVPAALALLAGCSPPDDASPGPAPRDSAAALLVSPDLVGPAWVASDTAAAPGSVRVFLPNGTVLSTSCVETYRIDPWRRVNADSAVVTEDGVEIPVAFTAAGDTLTLRTTLVGGETVRTSAPTSADVPYLVPPIAAPDPFGDALPTLETPRLRLRPVTPADDDALFAVFSDPEGMRYWSHEPLADLAAARAYRAKMEEGFRDRALFQWVIADRADDRLVGTTTVFGWEQAHRRAELGYLLGRAHWGRGLAQEAVRAVLAFGFGAMHLHRVEADVDPENAASVRLLERLGFTREGFLPERWFTYGEFRHTYLYGLLARDFPR
jgi:ribosomal-protein-alanine N-acetyltransferase